MNLRYCLWFGFAIAFAFGYGNNDTLDRGAVVLGCLIMAELAKKRTTDA